MNDDDAASPSGSCVFCDIRDGRDEINHVLLQRDGVIALLNLAMVTEGHTLVVPARHVQTIEELTSDEAAVMWEVAREVRAAIRASLAPAGFVYVQNEGAGYVTEDHLHLHVLPRYPADTLRDMWETRPRTEDRELARTFGRLTRVLEAREGS